MVGTARICDCMYTTADICNTNLFVYIINQIICSGPSFATSRPPLGGAASEIVSLGGVHVMGGGWRLAVFAGVRRFDTMGVTVMDVLWLGGRWVARNKLPPGARRTTASADLAREDVVVRESPHQLGVSFGEFHGEAA